MHIGVDLDEVLADFLRPLLAWHNERYGTSLDRDKFRSYRFEETWGGTRDDSIGKVYEFYKTPHFQCISPICTNRSFPY